MAIVIKGVKFDTMEEVAKAVEMGVIEKHDVLDSSPHIQPAHGLWHDANLGGLFSGAGAESDVFHTVVRPTSTGFLSQLMRGTTTIQNPLYDVLSGVRAINGTAAADACSQAPKAGEAKLCTLTSTFGEINVETEQGSLVKMGGRLDRADVDRRLVNQFMFNSAFLPEVVTPTNLNTTGGLAMFTMAVTIERELMRTLFTGVAGTAAGIFTDEFNGFDSLLVANPVDHRGNTCSAASSTIVDWSDTDVTGSVNGADIVETMGGVLHHLTTLADTTALGASWVIAMDRDLFYRLTEIWPCSYLTDGCSVTNANGERVNVDAQAQVRMRDEMRTGSYLWVMGRQFPVLQVDGSIIERTAVGTGFSSSIYIIPMTALGRQVTYLEAFDLNNSDINNFVDLGGGMAHYRTMNNGLYAMTTRQSDFCIEYHFNAQPRLVCRTPWLGARIESVNYTLPDFAWSRVATPGVQYHLNGGAYYNSVTQR